MQQDQVLRVPTPNSNFTSCQRGECDTIVSGPSSQRANSVQIVELKDPGQVIEDSPSPENELVLPATPAGVSEESIRSFANVQWFLTSALQKMYVFAIASADNT